MTAVHSPGNISHVVIGGLYVHLHKQNLFEIQ